MAPQGSAAIGAERTFRIRTAVGLAAEDARFTLQNVKSAFWRKGDIVRCASRALLAISAMADTDAEQGGIYPESYLATGATTFTGSHERSPEVARVVCPRVGRCMGFSIGRLFGLAVWTGFLYWLSELAF